LIGRVGFHWAARAAGDEREHSADEDGAAIPKCLLDLHGVSSGPRTRRGKNET
jgi:hypothetical protein